MTRSAVVQRRAGRAPRLSPRGAAVLAFYVAGVLASSLGVAAAYYAGSAAAWAAEGRAVAGFVLVYRLALVSGAPASLVSAFLLRRTARALRLTRTIQWLATGGALGVAVVWAFSRLGYLVEATYFTPELQPLKRVLVYPFMGPMMFWTQPLWVLLAVGMFTALVLHRVQQTLPTRLQLESNPEPEH